MKQVAEVVLRSIATFGVTAAATTILDMFWSGARITSDDSYIIGMSVGVVVGTILLITLLCERASNRKISLWVCAALYSLLAAWATFAMATSELHGPGIAALILGGSIFFGAIELGILRRLKSVHLVVVGLPVAVAFVTLAAAISL